MDLNRILVICIAFMLASGCAQSSQLSDADKAKAEALYQANCAGCHDGDGTGAPNRSALETRQAAAILASLESGLMREQGKALMSDEKQLLANYLGAKTVAAAGSMCKGKLALEGAPLWNRWGNGVENRRYQPAAQSGITTANVGTLELKWAFAFPDAARARSQPAVTEEAIFTGSPDGRVYALDSQTGCIWWTFNAESEVRSAPTLGVDPSGKIDRIYFGDFNANVYALDARTGELIWKQKVKDHPAGTITGSPTLYDGTLYVPMSSTEVVSAMEGAYSCCSFRGGVAALNASDGKPKWRMYTTEESRVNGKNSKGVPIRGPSGAPVWSSPTIDTKRGLLYIGTGENYSSPANDMSDAIIAVELGSGAVRWIRQVTKGDAWNAACIDIGNGINCPRENGPDFDFGAPPILIGLEDGRDIILAGQKSGMIYGLDPDADGKILWQQRAGMGGFNGGIHWGMASDGTTLFVGIADTPGNKFAVGPRRNGVHAYDPRSGEPLWSKLETPTCNTLSYACDTALSAPLTLTDGIIFAGAHNGMLKAYSARDGKILWSTDTKRPFRTVNGVEGKGGTIDSSGPVLAGNMLIVNSGYDKFGLIPGNVLLVFGPRKEGTAK